MKLLLFASSVLTALLVTGCDAQLHATVSASEAGLTASSMKKQQTAPPFSLTELGTSQSVSLKSLMAEGHPIVLNAFGSWCPPCNREEPDLETVYRQYQGKVTFVGIDIVDTTSGVKSFVYKYGVTYPVLLDKQDTFMDKYALSGPPETFIITPSGKIAAIHRGQLSKSQAETLFKSASKLA